MNTLRNLKKISNTKNFITNKLLTSKYQNFHTLKINKITNNKKSSNISELNFLKLKIFNFSENLENKIQQNPEIIQSNKNEAINFSLLYNPEITEKNILQEIFEKLEKNSEENKPIQNKNMFHKALSDISKRFPLEDLYSIEFYEKNFLRKKFLEKNNPRENLSNFQNNLNPSKTSTSSKPLKFTNIFIETNTNNGNKLTELANNLTIFYQKDDKVNFLETIKNLTNSFRNINNNSLILAENYFDLMNFLKTLCPKEEFISHQENLFEINSFLLIKLINELQLLILEQLGQTSEINFTSFKKFENLISEIFHKFNLFDSSSEKNNTFSHNDNILITKENEEKFFKEENFLQKNLNFYLTNCIGFILKNKENNSIELGKLYFLQALINLKNKNFDKVVELNDKILEIFTQNSEKIKDKNSLEFLENNLNNIYHIYLKSFLISVFVSNKKEQFILLKEASNLIEKFESEFYEKNFHNKNSLNKENEVDAIDNNNSNKDSNAYDIEKDFNFSALKFKVFSSMGITYEQNGFLLDAQKCLEKSLKINTFFLKSNRNLLMEYFLISDILIEKVYNFFNLFRPKYSISKKNFDLAFYLINNNEEKNNRLEIYSKNIINLINQGPDVFNLENMLKLKGFNFEEIKGQQENFSLSLINYFQGKKDYYKASIFIEYLNHIYSIDTNMEENFQSNMNLVNGIKIKTNLKNKNHEEILEGLILLRDSLEIEEFMIQENLNMEKAKDLKKRKNANAKAKEESEENANKANEEVNNDLEFLDNFEVENKFQEIYEDKKLYEITKNFGIALYYNILINEIKCNRYSEAFEKIKFLINFINSQNENKTVGSIIDHPHLLINLNLLAVHYYLIKNQKIYSVPYLREINSMLVKYDWGENTEINTYLKEMVELIKNI